MSFEEWFKNYPKKIAIGSARTAYSNAIFFKGASEEELLEAVKAYSKLVAGQDRQFIPKPCNWLQEERWQDEDVQAVLASSKEKTELSGWKKAFSETLGYQVYKAWCADGSFDEGIFTTSTAFKADWLKNNRSREFEKLGVRHIKVMQ